MQNEITRLRSLRHMNSIPLEFSDTCTESILWNRYCRVSSGETVFFRVHWHQYEADNIAKTTITKTAKQNVNALLLFCHKLHVFSPN